jgi:hypothetical protein
MVLLPHHPPSSTATTCKDFEWRVNAGPWRWLILSALGVAPSACGGRTHATPESTRVNLEGRGGATGESQGTPGGALGGARATSAVPTSSGGPLESSASACSNSVAVGGGWFRCDNGMLHRETFGECPSSLPRPERVTIPAGYEDAGAFIQCREDSDCNAAPLGYCSWNAEDAFGTFCNYGCVVDADCEAGYVCLCGDIVGQCAQARCAIDSDCGTGQLCSDFVAYPGCGGTAFACQTAKDECAAQDDCPEEAQFCTLDDMDAPNRRVCSPARCVIGRPFLVDGRERLAPPSARADWCSPLDGESVCLDLDARLRAEVVRGWTEQALMEHASVAAFARFSLQLLSLGAPPDLVMGAADAMQDEIRHARACFGLARRYSGHDIGPGSLAIDGACEESDLRSVVLGTIAEGCIGETVAALEAAEALAHCQDAAARAVLERIAVEESRHAELAWRFVAWALQTGPQSLKEQVRSAFAAVLTSPAPSATAPSEFDRELLRHGLSSVGLRRALRERVLAEVIEPCVGALLELEPLASDRIDAERRGRVLAAVIEQRPAETW